MSLELSGKTIVVGITGSIAAYKGAEIVSRLTQLGATVRVVMTQAATRFVTPLTLCSLSGQPVITDMFAEPIQWRIEHVGLADEAVLVLIAPATADTIARLAHGLASDSLCCLTLSTRAPILVAPAMDSGMYEHPATRSNLARLRELGYEIIPPGAGWLASGKQGAGRLADPEHIVARVLARLVHSRELAGVRLLVTAGPTREPLDAVRFISNRSSGRMGYALSEAARRHGAHVTLVTGPTHLPDPLELDVVRVETAKQMHGAVVDRWPKTDVLIGAAAPADFAPAEAYEGKLKKEAGAPTVRLEQTPDILAELGEGKGKRLLVGFAAETENLVENARTKLQRKHLDLVVANEVSVGFGGEENQATLVFTDGRVEPLERMPKAELAERIIQEIVELRRARERKGG